MLLRHAWGLVLSAIAIGVGGCGGDEPGAGAPIDATQPELTYHRDVRPILEASCVGCHQPGQIGVGELTDYAQVFGVANAVRDQVAARVMPPWLAGPDCNEYASDPSLSEEQIETIVRWVDAGAPEGDESDFDAGAEGASSSTAAPSGKELPRVDHELALPVAYVPSTNSPDDYRCFLVDWPETNVSYVTGYGVRPGNASAAHHMIAYIAPPSQVESYEALDAADEAPGYPCYGGPGGPLDGSTSFFGAWAPGANDVVFPASSGILMEPGSKVVIQMHYNTITWDGEADQTEVWVMVEDSVEREGRFEFFTDPTWVFSGGMDIPAGEPSVIHSAVLDPSSWMSGGQPFDIWIAGLHLHTRGTEAKLAVKHQSGDEACMLDIPRWDFDWQFSYELLQPIPFSPGDQMSITCQWDNSFEGQPVVDGKLPPPVDLDWGEGTNDEMCLGVVYITL